GECSGSTFHVSSSAAKQDIKDAIENYGVQDQYILATTNLIEKTAYENQTDKAEISHHEALAENEESHSADKQIIPKLWEERYERIWVENEKRELKTNFKNITAELKQLFGEINETGKTTSLVEEVSEDGFSEELKSSRVVLSCARESSDKLESKGEFGDIKVMLGGKVPQMEIVIPSLGVIPGQNNLNANVEDIWSTDEEDSTNSTGNTKVPLAKGEEKKMPTMATEENANGSSRSVEGRPEYFPRQGLKASISDDVSNILLKVRPVSTSDENALFVTERKPGKYSGFDDDVRRDCLIGNNKIGETAIESLFENAQQSCGMLKRNIDEELKQDLERFKSKVELEKSKERCFKTQEVAKQEDLDKFNTPPGNVTNQQMKQKLTLRKNDCLKMENENTIEEKDKKNLEEKDKKNCSPEERSKLIKMPMKGKFALNAKVARKNKRQTSKQKANQQMSSSSGNHFQVLDDSTFSETSQDDGRLAAKTGTEKNKVSIQMDVTDDLDLTHSSDTTSEDVELPTSIYREAMLLLEQLSVDPRGSAVLLKIQNILLEYEQIIEREKNRYTAVWRALRKLESEKEESQLMAEETKDWKSILAHQEVEWKSDIQTLKFTLKQEEEKRLRVETLNEKTREKLRRREDQCCKEMEEKQQLELHSRNLEMELLTLRKVLKQVEEERDETQRQLSQEKSARALQEGILNNHLWRQKELEEETRTIGKNVEESETKREKDLLYKNQLLQDEIAMLRLELDQVRLRHQEEKGKYLEENETLKEKNEDLKKELKLNEEALTQTVFQYNGQLNLLKTESAVLTSKLEQTKESKERLETEIESFRSRLTTAVQELEHHQSTKSDVERTFQRERDEWLRLQDKLHHDLSDVRETNKSLSQQLSKAESKANSLENELHQLKQMLREKTLLLEMTQKELSQAQCQAKECDRARQLEKDQVSKFIIKQESMQERLSQLQSENLLLRQQLEDMQNKGIIKEKVVNAVQDRFNDIFNKLRADTEKQVYLVEERNKELNVKCTDLRDQVFKYETDKVEREMQKQNVLAWTSKDAHSMWEEQLKSRYHLEERVAQLDREKAELLEQCESERKQAKKLAELKRPVELRLDQEMKRNIELQKDCKRLKRLLNRAMNKLRMYKERESQLHFQGEMKNRYSEMVNEVGRLRAKVGEHSQQLEIESKKCMQLEAQNQDLREELSTMHGNHEELERSKCQLKEEVANLKHRLETNMVDHSQIEQYKREMEERTRQEIRQRLQEVNLFLQTQAASQDRLEQIRANHHASLRNQLKHRIRDLECELDRIKSTQKDSIFQKESTQAEVERYKGLYLEEVKIRRCLANKLQRANERLAEANAKLLQERHRSKSLIASSIVSGGLAASPVLYSAELGHLGNNLALNRSVSLGGSFLSPTGNALASRNRVEAYVAKVRQELDEKITKELEQATAELEAGSAGASPMVSIDGFSKNFHVDQDPLCRAIQEYRDVLTKNYMI
ncbi:ankyrin repeat domain-containing protein 36A-like, partial [Grus japonensis]